MASDTMTLERTSSEQDDNALNKAKQDLIDAGLILEAEGLGDLTRGHVSIRVPGNPSLFIMKPHSYGFDEITMENIVTCDMEGNKIGTGGRRHSEVFIHSEIYKVRPDVNSVIHVHPTHAVALSVTGRSLRSVSQPATCFADGLPYYTDTIALIRTKDMGRGIDHSVDPARQRLPDSITRGSRRRHRGRIFTGSRCGIARCDYQTGAIHCKFRVLAEKSKTRIEQIIAACQ